MEVGDRAQIDPRITGSKKWIEGKIIKIRNNPFLGKEIAIKNDQGEIFFDQEKFFKTA